MRIVKILVLAPVTLILLSLMIPSWTAFGQADIPLEEVEDSFSNETDSEDDSTGLGSEQITLKAELEPHENEFLADDGYYEINKFGFVSSNGSEICPSNQCKYGVEDGQFSPNSFTGGYTLDGRLKVTTEEGDTKKTKFYNFDLDLEKISEEERGGETMQTLEGTIGFGSNSFDPDFKYDIINATLLVDNENPVLTVLGER